MNRQGRVISGMCQPAPAGVVVREAGLGPVVSELTIRSDNTDTDS